MPTPLRTAETHLYTIALLSMGPDGLCSFQFTPKGFELSEPFVASGEWCCAPIVDCGCYWAGSYLAHAGIWAGDVTLDPIPGFVDSSTLFNCALLCVQQYVAQGN